MTAPTCPKCGDTGSLSEEDFLDCTACDAAEKRAELARHMSTLPAMWNGPRDWAVYQFALSRTIAAQPSEAAPLGYLRQSEIDKMADPRVAGVGMMLHKESGEGKVAVYLAAPTAAVSAAPFSEVERDAALKFADHIINGMFEGGNWDGGDVQELAVKYGLLKPETMQGPCNEDGACQCAQNSAEFPSICYRKTYCAAIDAAIATGEKHE